MAAILAYPVVVKWEVTGLLKYSRYSRMESASTAHRLKLIPKGTEENRYLRGSCCAAIVMICDDVAVAVLLMLAVELILMEQ